METKGKNWYAMSDAALIETIGSFIKDYRLQQNKTQQELAQTVGINRSTLRQIENGAGGTLLSIIQLLRSLDKLEILEIFKTVKETSPLQLAKAEQNKRQRVRSKNTPNKSTKTDW